MRKRLVFAAPPNPDDANQDSFGQPDMVPGKTFTVWGSVEALSGREYLLAAQSEVVISHKVTIRFSLAAMQIAKDWQTSFEGHTLFVEVPPRDVEGRRRELVLMCREATV